MSSSVIKTRQETAKFNKTMQGFLGTQSQKATTERKPHTSQAEMMRPKSQLMNVLEKKDSVAQSQGENTAYLQFNRTDYLNYKFPKAVNRNYITEMPPKKAFVHIFQNKRETLEKAIQDLQIKRLHFKDDFVDNEVLEVKVKGMKGMKRSSSVQHFRKSVELARIHQVENSAHVEEEKKNQTKRSRKESQSVSQNMMEAKAGDETAVLDSEIGQQVVTGEPNKLKIVDNPEYFRKTYIKEFKIGPDGRYNGNNPSLKNKLLKQEFNYYSELTQRLLDDLSSNLQQQALGIYSYEEYKVLKSNFSKIFGNIFMN